MSDFFDRTVSVKSLHPHVTKELIEELFLQIAPLKLVNFFDGRPRNDSSSNLENGHTTPSRDVKSSPYAYVEFQHVESVLFACEMLNNVPLFGKPIKVSPRSKYQIFQIIEQKEMVKKVNRREEKAARKEEKARMRREAHEEKMKRKQEKRGERMAKKKEGREARKSLRLSTATIEAQEFRYDREEMFRINSELEIHEWVSYGFDRYEIHEDYVLQSLSKHNREAWYHEMLKTPKTPPKPVLTNISLTMSKKAPKVPTPSMTNKIPVTQKPPQDLIEVFKNHLEDLAINPCSIHPSHLPSLKSSCEACRIFESFAMMTLELWEKHVTTSKSAQKVVTPTPNHDSAQDVTTPQESSLPDAALTQELPSEELPDKGYMQTSVPRKKKVGTTPKSSPKKMPKTERPQKMPIVDSLDVTPKKRKDRKRTAIDLIKNALDLPVGYGKPPAFLQPSKDESLKPQITKDASKNALKSSEKTHNSTKDAPKPSVNSKKCPEGPQNAQDSSDLPIETSKSATSSKTPKKVQDSPKRPKIKPNGKVYPALLGEDLFFSCDICESEFNNLKKYRNHMKSHTTPGNTPSRKGALKERNDTPNAAVEVEESSQIVDEEFVASRRLPGGMFRRGIRVVTASKKRVRK